MYTLKQLLDKELTNFSPLPMWRHFLVKSIHMGGENFTLFTIEGKIFFLSSEDEDSFVLVKDERIIQHLKSKI